jgi:hypothetical protein
MATDPPATVTLDPTAPRLGDLSRLDGLGLPSGRLVVPEAGGDAVAWVSDQVGEHAGTWARLAVRFPETGWWPLLANGLAEGDLSRPWHGGELGGPDTSEARDVVEVLATATRSPGPVTLPVPVGTTGLLLVPVTRPADVPRALGWYGPANHDLSGSDVAAVLGSWEDRFGAVLVGMGFDVLHVAVAAPPSDPDQLALLAQEHYAFCPDNVDQGVGSLEAYAPLLAEREWWFWWD